MESDDIVKYPCTNCYIGYLRSSRATYARWYEGQFVVLPGVPAWTCDVCGETVYDDEVLARLNALLGPEVGFGEEGTGRRRSLKDEPSETPGRRYRIV